MEYKEILTKKPWGRYVPDGSYLSRSATYIEDNISSLDARPMAKIVTQADFLREYYPQSHLINDPVYYPDIYREEEVEEVDPSNGNPTGKTTRNLYVEHVPRYAFAFQQIITAKQMVHICGNDIQFDLNTKNPTQKQKDDIIKFGEGWTEKNMEVAFYDIILSNKITGDGAIVGFMKNNNKFCWKALSYKTGDRLYPHYNEKGELILFAHVYTDFDESGQELVEWVEVWDKQKLTRYRKAKNDEGSPLFSLTVAEGFKLSGYKMVGSPVVHMFNRVPVVYFRTDDGACWSSSQDSIDGYELAFSQMAHNNQAFGEPILYFQGDSIDIGNGLNGTIKTLSMGTDDKAGYLQSQSAADSYEKQLQINYRMIYEQSFTVIPPELKSGDLPAAALKILYSPAYEKAMNDAHFYQSCLDDLVDLFAYGYGLELGSGYSMDFRDLPLKSWIEPYVHVNNTSVVTDIATAVQNKFLSKQTASERIKFYSIPGEWERIIAEQKEEEKADLLYMKEESALSAQQSEDNNNNE